MSRRRIVQRRKPPADGNSDSPASRARARSFAASSGAFFSAPAVTTHLNTSVKTTAPEFGVDAIWD